MNLQGTADLLRLLLWPATAMYAAALWRLSRGLRRLKRGMADQRPFVSVVVPARNEEQRLGDCLLSLLNQSYPLELFEIIVVDDDSEDGTRQAAEQAGVTVLSAMRTPGVSPKKAALHTGIAAARGEIILTTDADCRVPRRWVETMVAGFEEGVELVASWLLVADDGRRLSRIERLDSFGYAAVGAAAFGLGRPFLANGANLAFRKESYLKAGGYDGIHRFASGDDDLLVQKFDRRSCRFIDGEPVVTSATPDLRSFFSQRLRWASKTAGYPVALVAAEVVLYLFHLLLFASLPLIAAAPRLALIWAAKIAADTAFLYPRVRQFGISLRLDRLLSAEILQTVTILIVGVWANIGSFRWKGRTYRRGRVNNDA